MGTAASINTDGSATGHGQGDGEVLRLPNGAPKQRAAARLPASGARHITGNIAHHWIRGIDEGDLLGWLNGSDECMSL